MYERVNVGMRRAGKELRGEEERRRGFNWGGEEGTERMRGKGKMEDKEGTGRGLREGECWHAT